MSAAFSADELLPFLERNVPRYTSYPTAPHFTDAIGEGDYRDWLCQLPPETGLSLYIHLPFCEQLCWYCGCHTKIVRRFEPVDTYLDALEGEIVRVADLVPDSAKVANVHWGGGTPTLLRAEDIRRLAETTARAFPVAPAQEFAVEIDPRGFDMVRAKALAKAGVNRASLGVQDLDPKVQRAVNRVQSLAETRSAVERLGAVGIDRFNIDLMYGLPHQTADGIRATIDSVLTLAPLRIAFFGYAHVPWMKRHQRLIDDEALPGPRARLAQMQAGAKQLVDAGYVAIGLDHFARADDDLALVAAKGDLRRNFQGYTTDTSEALIGLGASAIGRLPQGHVQNLVPIRDYVACIRGGKLATARGIAVSNDDRLRCEVIERLMCDLRVDLAQLSARHGRTLDTFNAELAELQPFVALGWVGVQDGVVAIAEEARPLVRTVAATFDRYLKAMPTDHAAAV